MSLSHLFAMRGLPPHGYCLLWDPGLVWLHVISDAIIGLSYFSIPIFLVTVLLRRRDLEFGWIVLLFGIFILACGTTHFMSILVLWVPAYGVEGAVKALTAGASLLTAIVLWPLLPKILAIPSPRQLQAANDALRLEAAERSRIEEQLRQSQKLEAIGLLTGGIAHDFNNILTVVMGNIERAISKIDEPAKVRAALGHAMEASSRADFIIRQLLSFARKQPLQIEQVDLNQTVRNLMELIGASVGESIDLIARLADESIWVEVDHNQLEAAIVNLAINARDAMPDGGTLSIHTSVVEASVVSIQISDTGVGMDVSTLERATEPFFTTKPVGHGTGLGLSQVYGFANQARGSLRIESSPGNGTTVTILLERRRRDTP